MDLYSGHDTGLGGQGDDIIHGGYGNDLMYGDLGNDALFGEGNDDQLYGLDGNDILIGGSGADTIDGGAGNDTIRGGEGPDRITGGAGADTFVYSPAFRVMQTVGESGYYLDAPMGGWLHNIDIIYDFTPGVDKIDLRDWGITFADLGSLHGGAGVYFDRNFDGEYAELYIHVASATSPLQASDFIFA